MEPRATGAGSLGKAAALDLWGSHSLTFLLQRSFLPHIKVPNYFTSEDPPAGLPVARLSQEPVRGRPSSLTSWPGGQGIATFSLRGGVHCAE